MQSGHLKDDQNQQQYFRMYVQSEKCYSRVSEECSFRVRFHVCSDEGGASDGIHVEAAFLSWCFWSDAVQPLSREQRREQLVDEVGGFIEDAYGSVPSSGVVDGPYGW